jgi:hypothetical protein
MRLSCRIRIQELFESATRVEDEQERGSLTSRDSREGREG